MYAERRLIKMGGNISSPSCGMTIPNYIRREMGWVIGDIVVIKTVGEKIILERKPQAEKEGLVGDGSL